MSGRLIGSSHPLPDSQVDQVRRHRGAIVRLSWCVYPTHSCSCQPNIQAMGASAVHVEARSRAPIQLVVEQAPSRQAGRQAGRETERQTDRDRQTGRQAGRQAERQRDRQTETDRQAGPRMRLISLPNL